MQMKEPRPRGASAIPASIGGYPISVCSITGSSTMLPNSTNQDRGQEDEPDRESRMFEDAQIDDGLAGAAGEHKADQCGNLPLDDRQ